MLSALWLWLYIAAPELTLWLGGKVPVLLSPKIEELYQSGCFVRLEVCEEIEPRLMVWHLRDRAVERVKSV